MKPATPTVKPSSSTQPDIATLKGFREQVYRRGLPIVAVLGIGLVSLAQAATIQVPADYATIQAAITAATAGDTINVAAGTYDVSATITVSKALTIQGAGIGQTVVQTAGTGSDPVNVISVSASSVTLKRMTIKQRKTSNTSIEAAVVVDSGNYPHDNSVNNFRLDTCRLETMEFGLSVRGMNWTVMDSQLAYVGPLANNHRLIGVYGNAGTSTISNNTFECSVEVARTVFIYLTSSDGTERYDGVLNITDNIHASGDLKQFYIQDELRGTGLTLDARRNSFNAVNADFLLYGTTPLNYFTAITLVGNHTSNTGGKGLLGLDGPGPIGSAGNTVLTMAGNILTNSTVSKVGWTEAAGSTGGLVGYNAAVFNLLTVTILDVPPDNLLPVLSSISPTGKPFGSAGFTLTVNGSDFMTNSVVKWGGVARVTTFVSSDQLTAAILTTDLVSPGTTNVTVFTPTPGGGTSLPRTFDILGPSSVVYVDDNYSAVGDNDGHTWLYDAFATIQAGVNAVATNGTVNVAAGLYVEDVGITKALTVKGAQYGIDVSGRTAGGAGESTIRGVSASLAAVTVNASNVTIDGFTINNPGKNNAVNVSTAINQTPSFSSNITISHNVIDNVGAASGLAGNVIAVRLFHGPDSVTIASNRFNNIKASTGTGSRSAQAVGVIDSASTNSSAGLVVVGNVFTDIAAAAVKGAYGVLLGNNAGCPGAQIKDNIFSNLNSAGWTHAVGLECKTTNAIVSGNVFNALTAASADDIAVWIESNNSGADTVAIRYNQFNGNGFYGVANGAAQLVVASSNYWGAANGPGTVGAGSGAMVSPNVVYNPWFESAAMTNKIYQVGAGLTYTTIQSAVNAASAGDTVNVAAGTYRERVVLNKSITVTGDRGDVMVAGPGPSAPILDGDLDNNGTPDMGDGFTIPRNTSLSGITVQGFIVRNFGNGGGGNGVGCGVISWENTSANVIIRDNLFTNLGYNGVYVGTDTDDIQNNWVVQRNIVIGAPYAGIELTDTRNSQVLDNEITASATIFDDPGDAGVGIEIAARARTGLVAATNITVRGNTINGAFASGSRAGINLLARAYNSGSTDARLSGITVEGNVVSGSGTRGIDVVAESRNSKPSRIENLTIIQNALTGNATGIEFGLAAGSPHANGVFDVATITVVSNKFAGNTAAGIGNRTTALIVAEQNWWGNATGPAIAANVGGSGDVVSNNVDFSPWLGDGTDTDAATGFQPNATPVYYTPAGLSFSTQPDGAVVGSSLTSQPVITVTNEIGETALQYQGNVTAAIGSNPSSGTLSGTTTQSAVNGVATFTDLSINKAGAGYTLVVTESGLSSATSDAFTVGKGMADVELASLVQVYDGSARSASATTAPPGLNVDFTYDSSANAPTNVGSYTVIGTINDANYQGSATNTLVIGKALATVNLGSLVQTYDGSARNATATTTPSDLAVDFTYNGSPAAPTNAGSYTVIGTINDANYQGSATNTLVVGCAVIILRSSLPDGALGVEYNQTLTASGGAAPYSYGITGGSLPGGLFLATNGILSGLPVAFTTNTFTITATDASGCTGSGAYTVTITGSGVADAIKPTLRVISPVSNTVLTNTDQVLVGTARDNSGGGGVAVLQLSVNGDAWQMADTANGFTNWTGSITLEAGQNTVIVRAQDYQGNSTSLTNAYFVSVAETLTVVTAGTGSVVGLASKYGTPANGANLILTRSYGIAAVNGNGYIFSNWLSSVAGGPTNVITTNSKCIFTMQPGLTLIANFVPNQFLDAAGAYNGLFWDTNNGVAYQSAGFANVKISAMPGRLATFSALLYLAGEKASFSGSFDLDGNAESAKPITLKSVPGATLKLYLHLPFDGTISGVVSNVDGSWTAQLSGDRAQVVNTYAGQYTMILPGSTDPAVAPGGDGYGLVTVKANGGIELLGALGDGVAISQRVPISESGSWPLFATVYPTTINSARVQGGLLMGWMSLNHGLEGTLYLIKNAMPGGGTYPNGFTNEFVPATSPYTNSALSGNRVIELTGGSNGVVILSGGDLSPSLTNQISLSLLNIFKSSVTNTLGGTNKLRLSVATKSGKLSGSFTADGVASRVIVGAVLQNANIGAGAFMWPHASPGAATATNTGAFLLQGD